MLAYLHIWFGSGLWVSKEKRLAALGGTELCIELNDGHSATCMGKFGISQ